MGRDKGDGVETRSTGMRVDGWGGIVRVRRREGED